MALCKKYSLDKDLARHYADLVMPKRVERYGADTGQKIPFEIKDVKIYVDGPLTFAVVTSTKGEEYTGWAKFNANDDKYTEHGGVYRALQKAADAFIAKSEEGQLEDQSWDSSSQTQKRSSFVESVLQVVRVGQSEEQSETV